MKTTSLAGMALLWATASFAADPLDVKLGLWETKATTEMPGMPKLPPPPSLPSDAMAKLPPEQRAKLEAMMKARSAGGPALTATKVCLTRESLANGMAFSRADKSCVSKIVTSTSSKQQVHMDCNQEGSKMAGDLTVERVDAEHLKGEMLMKAGAEGGRPMDMKMSFETRWISADCGSVKPAIAK